MWSLHYQLVGVKRKRPNWMGRLTSLDLVEVNPILDSANATATLAVELALSALGKQIL